MTKNNPLMDAESSWSNRLAVLETHPRPLSQQERDRAFADKLAELRKSRRSYYVFAVTIIATLAVLGAVSFTFIPDSGGRIFGAVIGALVGAATLWVMNATQLGENAGFSDDDLINKARTHAYPALATGQQLDEVAALVNAIPELKEIARDWLARGPLSVREYEDLMQAGRVHTRLVEERQADKQRQQSGERLARAISEPAAKA